MVSRWEFLKQKRREFQDTVQTKVQNRSFTTTWVKLISLWLIISKIYGKWHANKHSHYIEYMKEKRSG